MIAQGEFVVDLQPLEGFFKGEEGISLSRLSINKIFSGDLEAKSRGEMLSVITPVDGSAGYVAIEQVNGALYDWSGSFVLQHFGVMDAGENRLILEVVPASGTGDFENLSGRMTIEIKDGKHYYELEYSLA